MAFLRVREQLMLWQLHMDDGFAIPETEGSSRRSSRHFSDWAAWFCLEVFDNMTD
jgi:hypothetical protein